MQNSNVCASDYYAVALPETDLDSGQYPIEKPQ